MPYRVKDKPGPKSTTPKLVIGKLHAEGMVSGDIAKVLDLKPQTVYKTISEIRKSDDKDHVIGKAREHIKTRILSSGMRAAKTMDKLLEVDINKVPQVAMAQVKAADSIYDRSGIIPEKAKEGIDINILIYQQNGWG